MFLKLAGVFKPNTCWKVASSVKREFPNAASTHMSEFLKSTLVAFKNFFYEATSGFQKL
jgi:hypothetical protein